SKWRDLLSNSSRFKIVHTFEAQLYIQFRIVFAQAVGYLESEPRADLLHDIVYIVPIDGDEFPFRYCWERFLWHTRKVGHYSHDKRQIPLFNCIADLHVVGDLYSGRPYPADFLL